MSSALPEFTGWPKIHRLSRDIIITEKIDGTNAQVYIDEEGHIFAGSKTRWLTPEADNFGFAAWVRDHADELLQLGPGHHFGEWYGKGIQRKYGLTERRFALFNVGRWNDPRRFAYKAHSEQIDCPECCTIVPILYEGPFNTGAVSYVMDYLKHHGSEAVPGFMQPEGIVVYHTASRTMFKKTFDNDEGGKPE